MMMPTMSYSIWPPVKWVPLGQYDNNFCGDIRLPLDASFLVVCLSTIKFNNFINKFFYQNLYS
jgi:hypothetical protein